MTRSTFASADSPAAVIRAVPWTVVSMLVMLIVALATGTLTHPPSAALLHRVGFSLEQMRTGDWWQAITANYVVDHPPAMLSSLVLVAVMVGAYEYRYGLTWTIAVWFVGTLAATVIAVPLWHVAAVAFDARPVSTIATAEVGSSAACWCAAGAWLGWPAGWRGKTLVLAALAVGALLGLLVIHHTYTDLEHMVALATGVLFFGALQRWRRPATRAYVGTWRTSGYLLCGLVGVLVMCKGFIAADGWLAAMLILGGVALIGIGVTAIISDRRMLTAAVLALALAASFAKPDVWVWTTTGAAIFCLWTTRRRGHPSARASASSGDAAERAVLS